MAERYYRDFASFWDFYVSQHLKVGTRVLHWVGSTLALLCVGLFLLMQPVFPVNLLWLPAALVSGYGFAWVSHFLVEKNRPATFLYPWWSFMGDWKMWWLMTRRQMDAHVARVQARLDDGWMVAPDRLAPPEGARPSA